MTSKIISTESVQYQAKSFVQGVIILLFLACNGIYAQSVNENTEPVTNRNYKIGVGDVLRVIVTKQPLLSIDNVRVSNEGTIRLPMLEGEISAACVTETDLAVAITEKYKKYLLKPQVYVAVQEFHSNPVAVLGAVNAPGRFDVQRPTRLLELLTFVNGPAVNAGKDIQIFRTPNANLCDSNLPLVAENKSDEELIFIPLEETLKGSENANPYVQAGDIITIAQADEPDEAYIIGNVTSAKIIILKEPITLTKAIAMAGGVTKDANREKIKISRQDPDTLSKTVIIANLKEIEKDNQKDILLQANDVIDVPGPSGTKAFLKGLLRTIIPTVTRGIIPIP